MRLAQYTLPGAGGDGELIVFYFGENGGGTTEANIQRWVGQFSNPDDPANPPQPQQETIEPNGLKVTIVQVSGTYTATPMGPAAPQPEPKPGQKLNGIIVEGGPQGNLFIRAVGPQATIEQHAAALREFAESARPAQ